MRRKPIALLDLGHVLLRFDFARFAAAASRLCALPPDVIVQRVVDAPLKLDFDTGRLNETQFLDAASRALEVPPDARDSLRRAWADLFTLVPGAEDAFCAIEARAECWILSDTDPIHHPWVLERFPFLARVQGFIASYEVGALKREGRPFEVALARIGVSAERIVFVDDREENVSIASAFGLRAVLFDNWSSALPEVHEALDAIAAID